MHSLFLFSVALSFKRSVKSQCLRSTFPHVCCNSPRIRVRYGNFPFPARDGRRGSTIVFHAKNLGKKLILRIGQDSRNTLFSIRRCICSLKLHRSSAWCYNVGYNSTRAINFAFCHFRSVWCSQHKRIKLSWIHLNNYYIFTTQTLQMSVMSKKLVGDQALYWN
jgi:hypothetical protein